MSYPKPQRVLEHRPSADPQTITLTYDEPRVLHRLLTEALAEKRIVGSEARQAVVSIISKLDEAYANSRKDD